MLIGVRSAKRFKFELSQEKMFNLLLASYMCVVEGRQRQFELTDEVKKMLQEVSKALTTNDGHFGLMFCGNCGNGKTTMAGALQVAVNAVYGSNYVSKAKVLRIIDAKNIVQRGKEKADFDKIKNYELLCIEDLGRESTEIMEFGNVYSPIVDLLEYRYDMQLFTVVTTNLQPKDIRQKYGERIADRANEMFKVVKFMGRSFRR